MTPLRHRFIEDLKLAGYSERTQEAYVRSVSQLSQHFHASPDLLSEDPVRQYFVHILDEKHWARSSITISLCGIKRFYEQALRRTSPEFEIARPSHESRLPVILTREEVGRILAAVRNDTDRACLTTIHACGLRLSEGAFLRVGDVDSARIDVHVVLGKGGALRRGLLQARSAAWPENTASQPEPHPCPLLRLGALHHEPPPGSGCGIWGFRR